MKKANMVLFVLLFFSIVLEATFSTISVFAETKEIQLMDEKWLKLSYKYEKLKKSNQWQLNFKRQSEDEDQHQRLKLKVTDEEDQVIDYPEVEDMIEEDGWLVEEMFSDEKDGQLSLELPQSIKKLNVYVQMDQQQFSTINEGNEPKVQENILKQKEPFILEITKKPANQATKTSVKQSESKTDTSQKVEIKKAAQTVTVSSEKFVGPKKETTKVAATQSATTTNSINRMYKPLYVNKETTYKYDAGTYPENSWQPEGQTNVINHQGGISGQSGWDNVQSWNVTNDNHDQSYIKYGDDAAKPNIQLRKYAQQTDKPDEFKVKLNVRGNTTYKPGVDIVFLLDNSGTMAHTGTNRKSNAVSALDKIIVELSKHSDKNAQNIRVGGHIFGSYIKSEEELWDWTRNKTYHTLSSDPEDWKKMKNDYNSLAPVGQTFTQRALQEAKDIFEEPTTNIGNRYKLLFHLTDGAPNMGWKPLTVKSDPLMYYDKVRVLTSDEGQKGSYKTHERFQNYVYGMNVKFLKPYPVGGQSINSYLTITNSKALDLKESGVEIHSIAVQISSLDSQEHPAADLQKGLYKMASKKANATGEELGDYFYYHAKDPSELTEKFKDWYQTIIRTVDKGVITDPLGDMVELVTDSGKQPKVTQVSNGAPDIEAADKPNITLENGNRQIKVNNLNLTRNQEIELEYTVRLKTNDASFVSNKWYPTNGETFLEPTPERTNDKLEFGRPSVKFQKEDFVIPVEKVWTDQQPNQSEDFWGLRKEVTAKLQKWNGSSWQDVESKTLNAGNNWKADFSAVEGGENNKYRVLEVARTPGYKQPTMNYQTEFTAATMPTGGIKITNELLRGDYSFWKFMEDGSTKFEGTDLPKFKVTRSGKSIAENLTPNTSTGKVTLTGLPIGNYTVEETYVPKGFQKMPNFIINVSENNSSNPTALVFKVNNSTEEYQAVNKLKDFSLKVEKVDEKGTALAGATFKLTGPDNYEKVGIGGPVFDFPELRPGRYTLTETDNPDLYEKIKEPITFTIAQDGKVTVTPHPNVTGSGGTGETENTIQLKVTNKKVKTGVLPRTGAFGIQGMFLAAGLLVLGGVLLSLVPPYLNKWKK